MLVKYNNIAKNHTLIIATFELSKRSQMKVTAVETVVSYAAVLSVVTQCSSPTPPKKKQETKKKQKQKYKNKKTDFEKEKDVTLDIHFSL